VEDILACIKKIQEYTHGMTYEQCRDDGKTVDAVIRNLEIIGEAAGFIPRKSRRNILNFHGLRCAG